MAFSYWESNTWLEGVDLVVIGAGIVGLTAAIHARSMRPHWRIVVLDADPIGGGGSTRNAGFSCFGSATELQQDRQSFGDEDALNLVRKRWQGLQNLRSTFGDDALGHTVCGSVELFPNGGGTCIPSAQELQDLNRWIQPVTGQVETFVQIQAHSLPQINAKSENTAILSPLEGLLDTGKMNRAFKSLAHTKGIDILAGIRVETINSAKSGCEMQVSAFSRGNASITATRILVATNALGATLIPELDVQPAVNHVFVTDRIPGFHFPHAVHIDAGYIYARPIENRILMGGGRHWGLDEAETRKRLKSMMIKLWPATEAVPIAYQWSGQLGVGKNRSPIVQWCGPNTLAAVRMGGMGIAIGMEVGRLAAEELTKN